jgi:molybdopterin-guanine dinucleotide biosynthesis protein A
MKHGIPAVILAGGKGKRAGGVLKTEIMVGGSTVFARTEKVLQGIFDQIIISTNTLLSFSPYDKYTQVPDIKKGAGPLAGIHAAMHSMKGSSAVFVFAGDMPFLDIELILMMIEHYRNNPTPALVPKVNDYFEPLHTIYSLSLLPEIEKYLDSERKPSVIGFLKKVDTDYIVLDDSEKVRKAFTNINSPGDLFY